MGQDWFSQNAPSQASKQNAAGNWFAANAPRESAIEAGDQQKPKPEFWPELGRGLKELGVGVLDFIKTAVEASPTTFSSPGQQHAARLKLARGVRDTVRSDVEKLKADPSTIGKIGRAAAIPLDVLGIPATTIADDLIEGNYGHALALGGGTLALAKGPQAGAKVVARVAPQLRGRLSMAPTTQRAIPPAERIPTAAEAGRPAPASVARDAQPEGGTASAQSPGRRVGNVVQDSPGSALQQFDGGSSAARLTSARDHSGVLRLEFDAIERPVSPAEVEAMFSDYAGRVQVAKRADGLVGSRDIYDVSFWKGSRLDHSAVPSQLQRLGGQFSDPVPAPRSVRERMTAEAGGPASAAADGWFARNAPDAAGDGGIVPPGDVPPGSVPPSGGPDIPPQRPLSATAKADEAFLSQLPDDVRGPLRAVWEKYDGFEDARRGVQPLERTQALADQINERPFDPSEPRTAANAEQIAADYDRLMAAEREYAALGEKVKAGQATDSEWLRHQELDLERVLVAERARASTAEAGRAMRTIRAKVEEYKAVKAVIESHDPTLQAEARAAMQSGWFRQYVVGNLTSGIATHERNFGGNLGMAVLDTMATATAGRQPTAAAGMVYGMLRGLPRGLKEFAHVMREGGSAFIEESKAPFYKEMPGGAANPWNVATRLLNATDRLWRSMGKQAEIDARAFTEAQKLGARNPREIADTAAQLRAQHPEWSIEADAIASNRLFQDRLGPMGQAVIQLRDSVPIAGFLIAPFARISMKLTKMNAAFSPLPYVFEGVQKAIGPERFPSQLAADLRAPGRKGELARARAQFGTAALAGLSAYVIAGKVTGDGPRDPGKRSLWLQNHQPNSIQLPNGTWASYMGLPALSIPLAALANTKESVEDMLARGQKVDEQDSEAIAWNVVARTLNSVTSASFLSGLEDFQRALENPTAYAKDWGARLTTTLQPLVGLQRTITQAGVPGVLDADTTVRRPEGGRDAWAMNTPGLSGSVPPYLDPFGEPVQRSQSPLSVGVLRMMTPKPDPVRDELQRLHIPLARPSGAVTVPDSLPPDIQQAIRHLHAGSINEHAQAQGREKRQLLERLIMQNPQWWRSLSPEAQTELIARAKASGTRQANEAHIGTLYRDALVKQLGGGR